MERKGITVFSICIAVVFAAALIFFCAAIYIEYGRNAARMQAAAADFIQNTADASRYYAPDSAEFIKLLRSRIDSEQNIAAVSITQNNKTVFAYPLSSPLITAAPDGSPQLTSSSSLVRLTSRAANFGSAGNVLITVAAYSIQPAAIYTYARIAFLLILAGTLGTAVLLLYLYLTEQNAVRKREPEPAEKNSPAENRKNIFKPYFLPAEPLDMDISEDDEELHAENGGSMDFEENDFPGTENEDRTIDEPTIQDMILEHGEEPENYGTETDAVIAETSDPTGLFSPATGFGWASYLEERLDSELIRSASSEEDLALMIIRFPGLDRTAALAKNIGALLLDFFKFRDLIFEYDKDGYSGILHDTDLENTIDFAEELNDKLNVIIEEAGFKSKTGIGISTRSFRLIPGKRLLTEAEQALIHALNDQETSIVAFRVDPDKYRQYISESAQNAVKESGD